MTANNDYYNYTIKAMNNNIFGGKRWDYQVFKVTYVITSV